MSSKRSIQAFVIAAGVLLLAGCRESPSAHADDNPKNTDPGTTMSANDRRDTTASYLCEEGHRVDVVRSNVARLALSDGRVVKLEVIEDSTPRTFTDHGLTFVEGATAKATLDDERGHTVACNATALPR